VKPDPAPTVNAIVGGFPSIPSAAWLVLTAFPATSVPATENCTWRCSPVGTTDVGMDEGVTEKWQVSVGLLPVQVGVPASIRVAPTTSVNDDGCTPLPLSWMVTSATSGVAWL